MATVGAALALCGCGGGQASSPVPGPPGRVGASIALLKSTGEVAVVNPDQGSVSLLDPVTLEVKATVDTGAEPHALLELASGALLVVNQRGGDVVSLDPAARAVRARKPLCAGPYGVAESPDGAYVAVACEWEGAVLRLDPATLAVTTLASGLSRPRAVAVLGEDVFVAEFTGGRLNRFRSDGGVVVTSLVPSEAPYRPALTGMTANLAAAILPAFGQLHVAHELVNNLGNTSAEKVADDYGSVVDGNPKINPAVTTLVPGADQPATAAAPPVLYALFDGGPRVFNGPSALAAFGAQYLLVACVSTADVAVLDAAATEPGSRAIGSFGVGSGPSGVAVDEAGEHAYVDNALDGSVSRLDLAQAFGASAPRFPAALTRVRELPARFSAAALAGRRLFFDAGNPHVTPSGVVACSTCHPGGGDDGLTWFVHTSTIPLKRRRTPQLANSRTGTAPFHWDGQFPTIPALVEGTITNLMAGDALLVDFDSVRAFLDEIVEAPVPAPGDAAAVARGRLVFESTEAGCAQCHSGPSFTDDRMHAVLDPASLEADDVFTRANTPGLHGLFLKAPYFHDGRSPGLRDLLTRPDAKKHGGASRLPGSQLDDLLAYLGSL